VERLIERVIFASRWLQAPLYLGLAVVLAVLGIKFFQEFVHLTAEMWHLEESQLVLVVLGMVDLVMVANLVVMVIISGYENFVSRIDVGTARDRLSWFGKLDSGSLKIKLASSIIAISSIHLLRAFLNAGEIANDKLIFLIVIHVTFLFSALTLAFLDRLVTHKGPASGAELSPPSGGH
jgi:uncharacterized protein (TIGR00645 family)